MKQWLEIGGVFLWEHYDRHGKLIHRGGFHNGIVASARNAWLDEHFNGVVPWYIGLIDDDTLTELADDDAMSSHPGWQEVTAYSQSTRQLWASQAASGSVLSNPGLATFRFTAPVKVGGLFLSNSSVKGGTAGDLWCTGLGDTVQEMGVDELLKAYYELTLATPL